jgi:hypothetical protein
MKRSGCRARIFRAPVIDDDDFDSILGVVECADTFEAFGQICAAPVRWNHDRKGGRHCVRHQSIVACSPRSRSQEGRPTKRPGQPRGVRHDQRRVGRRGSDGAELNEFLPARQVANSLDDLPKLNCLTRGDVDRTRDFTLEQPHEGIRNVV